jgi:hypothetical protein
VKKIKIKIKIITRLLTTLLPHQILFWLGHVGLRSSSHPPLLYHKTFSNDFDERTLNPCPLTAILGLDPTPPNLTSRVHPHHYSGSFHLQLNLSAMAKLLTSQDAKSSFQKRGKIG